MARPSLRRIQPSDAAAVAEFLDRHTLTNRWLVAFFRNFPDLPAEAAPYWGLWAEENQAGAAGGPGLLSVAAHNFATGISYVAGAGEFSAGGLDGIITGEFLPERLVGDSSFLERW